METYTTAKTYSYADILREEVIFMYIVALSYAAAFLWMPEGAASLAWSVPAVMFLKDIYDKSSRDRLQQITFDVGRKGVVLSYKSMFSEVKQKRVLFNQARLEVVETKSKLNLWEPLTVYFLSGTVEVFKITQSKDGLPVDTLKAIVQAAEQHGIPIHHK